MKTTTIKTGLLFFLTIALFWPCTKVPFTNRKQVTGIYGTDQILQMSYQAYGHVLDSVQLSTDEEKVAMIKRVGANIQAAAE